MMGRKLRVAGMAVLILGCFALSACRGGDPEGEEKAQSKESSAQVSQFADARGDIWQESWSEKTASGASVRINISSLTRVPKIDRMSVVEVRRFDFNEENKRKLLESVFGSEIYDYESEKLPKYELQRYLAEYEKDVENGDKSMEKIVEDIKKNIKDAPEDFERIKEGDYKGSSYMGRRNGIDLIMDFREFEPGEMNSSSMIYMSPRDGSQIDIEEVRGKRSGYSFEPIESQESENTCSLKKEEAQKLAEEFLQKAGFPDLVKMQEGNMKWEVYGEKGETSSESYYNGWFFEYGPGVGNTAFMSFGSDGTYEVEGEQYNYTQYSMNCCVGLYITDKGVIQAQWESPVETVSMTQDVKLLPLDTIKEVIRNEMGEYAGFCQGRGDTYLKFNRLDLIYYRVSDPDNEDLFTYIPAWRLTGDSSVCFVVNAMDGSVIKDWDDTYGLYVPGEWIF